MNRKFVVACIVGFVQLGSMTLADDVTAARARYQRLMREVKSVDSEYSRVLQQAFNEKKKDGKASLEAKSRLIALSDKRDRTCDRLLLLSLRHGWDIPDTDKPGADSSPVADEKERIFTPADQMIREKFAQEARRIADKVKLPLITIKSATQNKRSAKKGGKKRLIF